MFAFIQQHVKTYSVFFLFNICSRSILPALFLLLAQAKKMWPEIQLDGLYTQSTSFPLVFVFSSLLFSFCLFYLFLFFTSIPHEVAGNCAAERIQLELWGMVATILVTKHASHAVFTTALSLRYQVFWHYPQLARQYNARLMFADDSTRWGYQKRQLWK